MKLSKERVMEVLTSIIEPTLGINIVDLGLVYEVLIEDDTLSVDLTLPTADESRAGDLATDVEQRLREAFEDEDVSVEISLTWDPPWSLDRVTAEARARLETVV